RGVAVFQEVCFTEPYPERTTPPGQTRNIDIWFPSKESPQLLNGDLRINAILIDGALEGAVFGTAGGSDTNSQLAVIRELTSKYGKPKSLRKDLLQNAFGMKVYGYTAQWRLSGLTVNFDGAADMNGGWLQIFTDKYTSTANANEQVQQKRQRRL